MMAKNIHSGVLSPTDDASFDELYRIYAQAIDASGRKSREVLREMVARPAYRFVIARRQNEVVGFAVLFLSPTAEAGLLEYLAVDEFERGRGLGAALFVETANALRAARGEAPLLLEVETDRLPGPKQPLRARRMNFYRRLGCRRIEGLDYLLPLDVPGTPAPAMDVLVYQRTPVDALSRATIHDWLVAVYREVYGRAADDPRIGRMLARLPDWVEVR